MNNPITIIDAQKTVLKERDLAKNWKEVSRKRGGIPVGVLCDFAVRGILPKKPAYRYLLGLPNTGTVLFIGAGNVPDGCQVLGEYKTCECGQNYISNHPCRQRCYTCRPTRKRKNHEPV